MPSIRQLYLDHVAQTSSMPLLLEVERASGIFIWDTSGKRYYDMNSGIAVSSLGHCHPNVVSAIQDQAATYMHTMVYGEHVHNPQVRFATLLTEQLDSHFTSVYYLMSGTEATELAMKIGRRHTGRYEIIACKNAYHGSTLGAESLRSDHVYKDAFLPLVPGIRHMSFNHLEDLDKITTKTACVICEVVQGEAGVIPPNPEFLLQLRERCSETGSLLVFDEIQSGFGRTGRLFAHQKYNVTPDLLLIGKAMGGGMPISGVVGPGSIMASIVKNPALGHITTFGGHPVSVAAAHAMLETLLSEKLVESVAEKEELIKRTLVHPVIKEVRSDGLMMAVEVTNRKYLKYVVSKAMELGVIVDYFLFNNRSFRLAPPLIITKQEISEACALLLEAMDFAYNRFYK